MFFAFSVRVGLAGSCQISRPASALKIHTQHHFVSVDGKINNSPKVNLKDSFMEQQTAEISSLFLLIEALGNKLLVKKKRFV